MFKKSERRNRRGFTLAEVLTVVAIIGILLAVAIPNVLAYYRSLKLTELDDSAKTIFMAAQSRLTAMSSAGQDLTALGDSKTVPTSGGTVNIRAVTDPAKLDTLVLGGSIESQLHDNNYVVEIDPKTGAVYAVWYWEKDGEFNYTTDAYTGNKLPERDWRLDKMVGYYGGPNIDRLDLEQTNFPSLQLTNAEELVLTITVPGNPGGSNPAIETTVTLSSGGAKWTIVDGKNLSYDGGTNNIYTGRIALDTFNTYSNTGSSPFDEYGMGQQFKDWVRGSAITPGADFDIEVKVEAVASGDKHYLPQYIYWTDVNGLFASVDGNTAKIAYGRHLQNLDTATSGVNETGSTFIITKAEQTRSIDFTDSASVKGVYSWADTYRAHNFTAIINDTLTSYNGEELEIRNLDAVPRNSVHENGAGLFGRVNSTLTIEDTYLVDAHAIGNGLAAGTLVGVVNGTVNIEGCRSWLSNEAAKKVADKIAMTTMTPMSPDEYSCVSGGEFNGGLVGVVFDYKTVNIEKSFASTVVAGTAGVGGLVGTIRDSHGTVKITNSYAASYLSGGHSVGGLVGGSKGTVSVENSYAAGIIAEVSGANLEVAGIMPRAGRIVNSYAAVRYKQDVLNATDVKFYGVARGVTATGASSSHVYYVKQTGVNYEADSGEAVSMSKLKGMIGTTPFVGDKWYVPVPTGTNVNPQGLTYPYNLIDGIELTDPYPYPMLASDITAVGGTDTLPMPHYGDWLENSYATSFYWEREGTDYNFYLVLSDGGTTPYIASSLCQLHHLDGSAGQHIGENDWGYGLIGIDRADVPFSDITEDTTSDKSVFVTNLLAFLGDTSVSWNSKPESEELQDINALFGDTNNMILLKGATEDKYTSISTDVGYFELNLGFAAAIDVTDAGSTTPTNMGKNADNAYQIRTTWQLDSINSDSGLNTSWFKQTHDIVYETAGTPHTEIKNFAGHYDGGFFRILDIDSSLFMSLNGTARLEHIILYSPDGADISGHGGLAMSSGGSGVEIEKCIVAGFNFSEASGAVGGLVGEVTNGALSITDCEAVNELGATVSTGSTANVGGLVGNVSSGAELTITGSYAGGTFGTVSTSAGGLVGASSGTVNYTGGVYSYVDMSDPALTAGTVYGIGPGIVTAGSTARYWSGGLTGKTVTPVAGVDGVNLSALKAPTGSEALHTYISGTEGLKDQNEDNNPYPFTPVVYVPATVYEKTGADIPVHYGDWPDEPAAQSFCYYDNCNSTYGVWGYIADPTTGALTPVNTLQAGTPNSGICATDDGYCIPVEHDGPAPANPTIGGTQYNVNKLSGTATINGEEYDLYKVEGLNGTSTTPYYNTITVGTTEYYFNPFFACEVIQVPTTGTPTAPTAPQAKEVGGTTYPQNTVVIRTARQLANMAEQTGSKYDNGIDAQNRSYVQLLNIDFEMYSQNVKGKDSTTWEPAALITGSYDGNTFVISNLYINKTGENIGMFGNTKGTLKNIRLKNTKVSGGERVGALVGRLEGGKIENCGVYVDKGNYNDCFVRGTSRVGGLAGHVNSQNNAELKGCFAAVKVVGTSGNDGVGGLIGSYSAKDDTGVIEDCYSGGHTEGGIYTSANVSCAGKNVGGLIGKITDDAKVTLKGTVYSTCSVSGNDSDTIGLLIGGFDTGKNPTIDSSDATVYATGKAFDKDGNDLTPREEKDYLTTDLDTVKDNSITESNTHAYDDTLTGAYPYKSNLTAHYGDWVEKKKSVEACFYWAKEGSGYEVYVLGFETGGTTATPLSPISTLCETHHSVTEAMGANATSNTDWGYGTIGLTDGLGTGTLPNGVTKDPGAKNDVIDALRAALTAYSFEDTDVTVYTGATADASTTVTSEIDNPATSNKYTYHLNLGFAAAISMTDGALGSSGTPYQIRNVRQLDNIPNDDNHSYQQTHDVYAGSSYSYSGANNFGGASSSASGTYDGQSYRILELNMTSGLFTSVTGYTDLNNIILYSPSGNATVTGGGGPAGGLAGLVTGNGDTNITNCVVAGYSMSNTSQPLGGLVGKLEKNYNTDRTSITNSEAVNTLTCNGSTPNHAGGLVGWVNKTNIEITNSYAGGKINDGGYVGGIVGEMGTGAAARITYTNVYSYMNITAIGPGKIKYGIGPCGDTSYTAYAFYNNCYCWSGGLGGAVYDGNQSNITKASWDDLKTCMVAGTGFSQSGDTVISFWAEPDSSTTTAPSPDSYPFPAVVKGYPDNTKGTEGVQQFVHYGYWPAP